MHDCTGVAASWCPRCGDCACPKDEHGERVSTLRPDDFGMDDPSCPLHAPRSEHGELPEECLAFSAAVRDFDTPLSFFDRCSCGVVRGLHRERFL